MEIMCLAGISHDYFQSDHFSPLVSTLVRILSAVNEKNLDKISIKEKKKKGFFGSCT